MDLKKKALSFVVLLGVVSLFADMTYEAARSITGPYLAVLGASAAVVGFVAGLGELIGYGLRIVSGIISDRSRRYWTITIIGYAVNLLAVPLLALAGRWEIAALLIVTERLGKAVRVPARDAMLSHAAQSIGRGWAFALHEALDQIGAMTGPIIVTVVFALKGQYSWAFAVLAAPALLALGVLLAARFIYPNPREFELETARLETRGFSRAFWIYLAATALIGAGFADFPLAAFHFKRLGLVEDKWIPLVYAGAMGLDAIAALVFGRWFDKKGLFALMIGVAFSCLFAPFIFSGRLSLALVGVALWSIGLGAQESIVRAAVCDFVSAERRATGYGVFNTGFGLAWFLGSALMGLLYDRSLPALMIFSVLIQLASLPLLYSVFKSSAEACPRGAD